MMTLENTAANKSKVLRAETAWSKLLGEVLKRGFYGTATLELSIQDGTIQHIRHKVEAIEK